MFRFAYILFAVSIFSVIIFAQQNEQDREWNQPIEPFRIVGNIYYVGASEITSYLIVTPSGHILIDGGFVETVPLIKANLEKLGFKLSDVKILLNSQAHYDHAAGFVELKRLTKARLFISEGDAPLLANGGKGDPNFGDRFPYEPAKADETFRDGKKIALGGTTLTANVTPGHTPGCTTWTADVIEKQKRYKVVFVCSTSTPGYKLVDNAAYPGIAADYVKTFRFLEGIKADVFLGAHGSMFDLEGKRGRLKKGDENPFIDPDGYKEYLRQSKLDFENKLKTQSTKKP